MLNPFKNIGPGTIVAAAFIGPGTVTVCTLAGVRHGYELLWAVLISMVATIVLQEMSARLGLVTQRGLMENLNRTLTHKWVRYSAVFLVLIAILLGNTAYEAGNIMGGTMGIQNMVGSDTNQQETVLYSLVIGVLAFALLYFGKYKAVEKTLIILVVTMSLTFVVTALLTRPDAGEVLRGLLIPTIPGNGLEVIAIIGTTVVPYNIFLHASIVGEKWKGPEDLKKMRADTYLAIALGGIISMAIIVSATSVNGEIQSPTDLAMALEPLLGEWARYFIGMG
ncbi:MAG TPA: Nramp family divalent metal transporter, partial [Membranihabitans sp.]|nr:Nramp family divalent metal transporter [Membranihabitans sp.]